MQLNFQSADPQNDVKSTETNYGSAGTANVEGEGSADPMAAAYSSKFSYSTSHPSANAKEAGDDDGSCSLFAFLIAH